MRKKIKELKSFLKKKKINCLLLFNFDMNNPDKNFSYLSGFDGYGTLLVKKDKHILFVPKMEYERAKREVKGVKIIRVEKRTTDALSRHTRGKTIGIDHNSITLSFMKQLRRSFKGKKFVDISDKLMELRATKTKDEIRNLRKACRISDDILERCFRNFRKFKTEQDVAVFLKEETRKQGCELSFPPIVASGSGAAAPHHTPMPSNLKKGFCIIDFGVKYKGYCSDTTRTLYIGKPSDKDKEIYDRVLLAQEETVSSAKRGMRCEELWDVCMHYLGGYAEKMIHGLGHGVGLNIHEAPNLKPKSKDVIEKGMVFTIEPGVYFPRRLGIRIEDTVLMDNKRTIILTKISKKLRIIKI